MENIEKFLVENSQDGGFLQSEEWENFQQNFGKKIFKINNNDFFCLIIQNSLPLVGSYFFIPRGPVFGKQKTEKEMRKFIDEILILAKKEKVGWIRVEPQNFSDLESIMEEIGDGQKYQIKKSRKDHEPVQTLMLDLKQGEEEILNVMKPKTRYNIRLCKKNGIKIFEDEKRRNFGKFFNIMKETAQRNKIELHSREYYYKMLEMIDNNRLKLYLAEYKGEIIGGILVSFYGGVAIYLHGASANKYRNQMAVYGLQWKAIKDAKNKGCIKYDFGGISEATERFSKIKNAWQGITRFKRGFCPKNKVVEFPGCWDIILNKQKYQIYLLAQKIKGWIN